MITHSHARYAGKRLSFSCHRAQQTICSFKFHIMLTNVNFASEQQDAAEVLTTSSFSFSAQLRPSARCCNVDHRILLSATQTRTPACRCRGGVDLSSITEADVDFCRRRPPLMTTAPHIFSRLSLNWTNLLTGSQSLRLYHDVLFTVLLQY